MAKSILTTGATGKQGGSVIDNLLKQRADVEILAVTRDVNSSGAQTSSAWKACKEVSKYQTGARESRPDGIFDNAQEVTS